MHNTSLQMALTEFLNEAPTPKFGSISGLAGMVRVANEINEMRNVTRAELLDLASQQEAFAQGFLDDDCPSLAAHFQARCTAYRYFAKFA